MKKNKLKSAYIKWGVLLAIFLSVPATQNLFGNTPKYIFGTLQNTTFHLEQNYDAGMRRAVLELNWDKYYPTEGEKSSSYVTEMLTLIDTYKSYGYDVMLDLGTQYAPSWLLSYENSRFKNQYGDYFSGGPGENIVNAVFNNEMRQKQDEYVQQVFADLGTDFACVKLGWLRYGELGYPLSNFNEQSNAYWCYDDIAQSGGEKLPEGVTACPVPGWLPGEASTDHADARDFYTWYVGALVNYQNWMISTTRKYYQGQLCMLYPSWGTRPGTVDAAIEVNLDGSTSQEINGEIQRAHDFQTLVGAISDPNVMVYCTWIDSNEEWSNDASGNPGDWSPVHWLANLAATHDPVLEAGGENSGGSDVAKMDLTFRRMEAFNLKLLMWAFDFELYGGTYAGISDYEEYITNYQEEVTSIEVAENANFQLNSFPNPVRSVGTIKYEIPAASYVSMKLYDATGKEVETLLDGFQEFGNYEQIVDGSSLGSGMYIVRLRITTKNSGHLQEQSLKLILVD